MRRRRADKIAVVIVELVPPNTGRAFEAMRELRPGLVSREDFVERVDHARSLLEWLHIEAERLECRQVHLDSGVGTNRTAAHRLYFSSGYRISSHHFAYDV